MKGLGKITGACLLGAAALAAAGSLLLTGCDKNSLSWWSPTPREVEVSLASLAVAEPVVVEPMGSRALAADAAGNAVSADDDGELFTVSVGPEENMNVARSRSLSTRADVTLQNVWVLQFDAAGATKACAWVGTVAAGQEVNATLLSGEGYTVWIVANGPDEGGLSTSNPATLADFENKMLHTAAPASDELIPLTGKLSGVKVLDNGQVRVGEDNAVVPEITLARAMARVDLLLEYDVSGAELDGVWLYQVPVGACYGLSATATGYPASATVANFGYRNGDSEGLASRSAGSGTVTHTWYVGDNRRGQVPSIQWEKNKGSKNAPKMATYARIKSHESADVNKGLFHDVYLGANVTTDFDVLRNRHYIYRVRIGGSLDDQKLLAERDDRVWAGMLEYLDGAPAITPGLTQNIDPNGCTFTIRFNGYWTGEGIPVRARAGEKDLATGTAVCQNNTGEVTLEIPKNEAKDDLQIEFAYQWKGEWMTIGIGTQVGFGIKDSALIPEGDIPAEGGVYSIILYGNIPEDSDGDGGGVRIRAVSGGKSLVGGLVLKAGTAVNLTIPANNIAVERMITFEYEWEEKWVEIEQRKQEAGEGGAVGDLYGGGVIYWVDPDDAANFRVVALDQSSSTLKWAANNSYVLGSGAQDQTERNGAAVWQIAKQYSDNKTGGASGTFATDFPAFSYCYEKTDGGVAKGTWYLPSFQELKDLYSAKGSVESVITANEGIAFSAGDYWSATEYSSGSSTAWHVGFSSGYTSYSSKPGSSYVRCVRDK